MRKVLFNIAIPFLATCTCLAPVGLFSQNCPDPNCPTIYYVGICLVTVDSASQKNLVVWDNEYLTIDYDYITDVNIYKESNISGVYSIIATQPVTQPSEYLDMSSQPNIKSDRYKIAAVDSCGCESAVSTPHKTIFLSASQQANDDVILFVDGYEGYNFNFYDIFGGSSFTVDSFGTFSSSLNSWTIPSNQLAITDTLFYVSIPIDSCISTKKLKTYNASKSNTAATQAPTSNEKFEIKSFLPAGRHGKLEVGVFPNPSLKGKFILAMKIPEKDDYSIEITNAIGQRVFSENLKNFSGNYLKEFDLYEYGGGVYSIHVTGAKVRAVVRVVVL